MARRATLLAQLRADTVPCLYIAGPEEFTPDADLPDPAKTGNASPQLVETLWAQLRPDAVYLSAKAARWFGHTPTGFTLVEGKPVTKYLHIGNRTVGLIFFPPLSTLGTEETEYPTPRLLALILAEARAASRADLLIGISPWGFQAELQSRAVLAQYFQMLLGAGGGSAFGLELDSANPSLLWSRADHDGRSLMLLELLDIPAKGMPPTWLRGLNVHGEELRLTPDIPEQPEMLRLLP